MIGEAFGDRRLRRADLMWIFQVHRDLDARVAVLGLPEPRPDRRAEREPLPSKDVGDQHDHGVEDCVRPATDLRSAKPGLAALGTQRDRLVADLARERVDWT